MAMSDIAIADGTQISVGRGACFFDRFTVGGAKQGSDFMGNVPKLEIAPTVELAEKRSSVDASNALLASIEKSRTLEMNLDFSENLDHNLALALFGDVGEYTQPATPVTGETLSSSSVQGKTYWAAARKLGSVTVKDDAASAAEGTDYEIDTETGAVKVIVGGGIADGSVLTIDYTPTAIVSGSGLKKVSIGSAGTILGEFRFVGNPANGKIHELILWKVQVSPAAALAYISDDFQDTGLKFRLIADTVNHPTAPYGVHYIR